MNIIVCVKQVPDPQMPMASFRIDPATNKLVPAPGIPPVINGYDEQAVEAALRLKEAGDVKITVLSMGTNLVSDVIKKPLSMGADELVLLQDDAFEDSDDYATARVLTAAIRKICRFRHDHLRPTVLGLRHRPGRGRHRGDARHSHHPHSSRR